MFYSPTILKQNYCLIQTSYPLGCCECLHVHYYELLLAEDSKEVLLTYLRLR